MTIDTPYLLHTLEHLISTPSPVGNTSRGLDLVTQLLCQHNWNGGIDVRRSPKGVLTATIAGHAHTAPRAITAHIDTIGSMVKEIKSNGRLKLAQLGSFDWSAIENENVTVETADGTTFTGTVLYVNPSYHVHTPDDRIDQKPRSADSMEVRLDARVGSKTDTHNLGIEIGDFVHFEPRFEIADGFIKSRFLDDKACLASVFAALKVLSDAGEMPAQTTTIHIGNYEEVCHGASTGMPHDVVDVLAIDVAPIGRGQNSTEFTCSIGLLDDDGPYDRELSARLRHLAKKHDIELRPDLYVQFSSDAKALWKSGFDARCALIGPGVDDTHGYERTHLDALIDTTKLIVAFLRADEAMGRTNSSG